MKHCYVENSLLAHLSEKKLHCDLSLSWIFEEFDRCCIVRMSMARSVAWRRTCPDVIAQRTEQVLQSTIYILHEIGPTAFVLKEEESRKKVKVVALNFLLLFFLSNIGMLQIVLLCSQVFLGDPHICSCSTFKKEHDLCIHILW